MTTKMTMPLLEGKVAPNYTETIVETLSSAKPQTLS